MLHQSRIGTKFLWISLVLKVNRFAVSANLIKQERPMAISSNDKEKSRSNKSTKERSRSTKGKTQVNLLEDKVAAFLTESNGGGGWNESSQCPSIKTTITRATCVACIPCGLMPMAIHVALFIMFCGSFLYNIWWDILKNNAIFKDWIYLTHWNLTFQVFFCTLELISDLSVSFAETTSAFRAKLFHTIIFPFSLFVCTFFWTLCLIDDNLVKTSNIELRYDEWYNHVVHTLIVPAALLQSMAIYHRPSGLIESYTITVICGFIYTCWSLMWGIMFDMWSYELFRNISANGLLLLLISSSVLLCVFQTLGRMVHQSLWLIHNRGNTFE